jgi:DNA gyrase subunit B
MVTYRDPTQAERAINLELAAQPEYKRLRSLSRQTAKINRPPFTVIKGEPSATNKGEVLGGWREMLAYVKGEGTREVSVQRYKGLGEMNATQLWETTMNIETRTLLKVSLEDLVLSDQIFTTLMGEDVEARRKFIEENALDVRNLDV